MTCLIACEIAHVRYTENPSDSTVSEEYIDVGARAAAGSARFICGEHTQGLYICRLRSGCGVCGPTSCKFEIHSLIVTWESLINIQIPDKQLDPVPRDDREENEEEV